MPISIIRETPTPPPTQDIEEIILDCAGNPGGDQIRITYDTAPEFIWFRTWRGDSRLNTVLLHREDVLVLADALKEMAS